MDNQHVKKAVSLETYVFIGIFFLVFGLIGREMGVGTMLNVIMKTAHDLLLNTVFFIMAIAVLAGALSALFSEFGIVALINRFISPVMGPMYNLPGAASLGAITTYLSDNPAIISLAKDRGFVKYFKNYQTPALCNLGTAFGMGLILTTYMISLGDGTEFVVPVVIGNLAAIIGSVVSVRLMMRFTKAYYHINDTSEQALHVNTNDYLTVREVRKGSALERALDAVLEGGKTGVDLGLDIIPGVIIICTMVMILTLEPSARIAGQAVYQGIAYEGIGLLPRLGMYIEPILTPLFGFQSPEALAFPITSLGSVGASLGLVAKFLNDGLIGANEIAVFTAMGMCWSGYLSTHVGMMDALGVRQLASKAILSHTFGGLAAGISAHYLFLLSQLI